MGGPFEAYGGGKSCDKWGKKFFHNLPLETSDNFHVAIVTPVIHYCMGGMSINGDAEALTKDGSVINGLYSAGEAPEVFTAIIVWEGTRCLIASCMDACQAVVQHAISQLRTSNLSSLKKQAWLLRRSSEPYARRDC